MEIRRHGLWIDGAERPGSLGETVTVRYPYDDSVVGEVTAASDEDVREAVGVAHRTFREHMRSMPGHERAAILRKAGAILRERSEDLARLVVREGGKPIRDARREAGRAAGLFELAADHVPSIEGQVLPMDIIPGGENRFGYTMRVPLGVVVAIAPFNSPINLAVNKIAPAIAAGNSVVLKPASNTPLSAFVLAGVLQDAGLPDGAFNVVVGSGSKLGGALARDDRVRMVTLTGSVAAGLAVTREAGIKKIALELGSSAANVVCADADIPAAAKSLATSAFLSSGQACIAAQRLIVHESVVDEFLEHFVPLAEAMVIGDPEDPATELGPMISPADVDRVMGWIDEARELGARVVVGGERAGRTVKPTLVANVPPTASLACEEAFAPVATLATFSTVEEAAQIANDSQFGLQGGVYTQDISTMFYLAREIDVGALWINDSSRFRQDNYPFGGMKLSGIGREGVQYAIEEMSELKFIGVKLGPSAGIL